MSFLRKYLFLIGVLGLTFTLNQNAKADDFITHYDFLDALEGKNKTDKKNVKDKDAEKESLKSKKKHKINRSPAYEFSTTHLEFMDLFVGDKPTVDVATNIIEDFIHNPKNYISATLGFYNTWAKTTGVPDGTIKYYNWTGGASLGTQVADGLHVEIDALFDEVKIYSYEKNNKMYFLGLIPGVRYYYHELFNHVRLYASVGVGPGMAINKTFYSEPGQDHMTKAYRTKMNVVLQGKLGFVYKISKHFDLDFSVRYRNYGSVKNVGPEYNVRGTISNLEYDLGLTYKF